MNAFEPEPTTSPRELANRVFTRTLLPFALTFHIANAADGLFGPFGSGAGIVARIVAIWLSYQLLFAAFDAHLEAGAEI